MQIRKAERAQSKLRIGLSGPSGSGKTYSALLLARGMVKSWEKILLIDTENGSGELYSHLGPYNVIVLEAPFTPERYSEAITAAETAGMEAIVIDSASHEWDGKGGCLESNERLGQTKFKGNSWAAWSETTPRHQKFIEAITQSKCHVITTARSKTDTIQTEDKKIKKVGLKDIQREGFEYELTANFNIDRDKHLAIASKDRTGLFIDRDPFIINEKIGQEFLKWTESGVDKASAENKKKIGQLLKMLEKAPKTAEETAQLIKQLTGHELVESSYGAIVSALEKRVVEKKKTDEEARIAKIAALEPEAPPVIEYPEEEDQSALKI